MTRVEVYPDAEALALAVAETVTESAANAVARYGRFLWCVAGGQTPRRSYELLATAAFAPRVDWGRTHVFFGDERCVPPSDERSNYLMVRRALLDRVRLPAGHVHRIAGERDPERAAHDYERTVESILGRSVDGDPIHGFDLLMLGMGTDGHTASLFPDSVDEAGRWVEARRHPSDGTWRVTLTPAVFDASAAVRVLVSGRDKARRLADVLAGPARPRAVPVQRIRPRGDLAWMVDRDAAGDLEATGYRVEGAAHIDIQVQA
jgi:6-phosphogluconolactonase